MFKLNQRSFSIDTNIQIRVDSKDTLIDTRGCVYNVLSLCSPVRMDFWALCGACHCNDQLVSTAYHLRIYKELYLHSEFFFDIQANCVLQLWLEAAGMV